MDYMAVIDHLHLLTGYKTPTASCGNTSGQVIPLTDLFVGKISGHKKHGNVDGRSSLWFCCSRIAWDFRSLLMELPMIVSTSFATFSVPRSTGIELLAPWFSAKYRAMERKMLNL